MCECTAALMIAPSSSASKSAALEGPVSSASVMTQVGAWVGNVADKRSHPRQSICNRRCGRWPGTREDGEWTPMPSRNTKTPEGGVAG